MRTCDDGFTIIDPGIGSPSFKGGVVAVATCTGAEDDWALETVTDKTPRLPINVSEVVKYLSKVIFNPVD